MLLRSLWHWLKNSDQGYVRVVGDAQGVLSALLKRASKTPLLNGLIKEITQWLAQQFRSVETLHVWSEYNFWPDSLSRLKDPNSPAPVPRELESLPLALKAQTFWRE